MGNVETKSIFDQYYGLLVIALSSCYFWAMPDSRNDNSKISISHGTVKKL